MTRKVESRPEIDASGPAVPSGSSSSEYVKRTAPATAVAEVRLDQRREVTDGERDIADSGSAELADEDLRDGKVVDRDQRLRQNGRVGGKPRSLAAHQQDRTDIGSCL